MGREGKEELERRKCRLNLHVVYLWRVPFRLFRVICAARVFVSLLSLTVSLSLSLDLSIFNARTTLEHFDLSHVKFIIFPPPPRFFFPLVSAGEHEWKLFSNEGIIIIVIIIILSKAFVSIFLFFFFFFYVTIWNLIKGTVLWTLLFIFFSFPSQIFRVQT